ncbi:MAG: flagellar hook-length control protein FliK [Marinibacterium sp.]
MPDMLTAMGSTGADLSPTSTAILDQGSGMASGSGFETGAVTGGNPAPVCQSGDFEHFVREARDDLGSNVQEPSQDPEKTHDTSLPGGNEPEESLLNRSDQPETTQPDGPTAYRTEEEAVSRVAKNKGQGNVGSGGDSAFVAESVCGVPVGSPVNGSSDDTIQSEIVDQSESSRKRMAGGNYQDAPSANTSVEAGKVPDPEAKTGVDAGDHRIATRLPGTTLPSAGPEPEPMSATAHSAESQLSQLGSTMVGYAGVHGAAPVFPFAESGPPDHAAQRQRSTMRDGTEAGSPIKSGGDTSRISRPGDPSKAAPLSRWANAPAAIGNSDTTISAQEDEAGLRGVEPTQHGSGISPLAGWVRLPAHNSAIEPRSRLAEPEIVRSMDPTRTSGAFSGSSPANARTESSLPNRANYPDLALHAAIQGDMSTGLKTPAAMQTNAGRSGIAPSASVQPGSGSPTPAFSTVSTPAAIPALRAPDATPATPVLAAEPAAGRSLPLPPAGSHLEMVKVSVPGVNTFAKGTEPPELASVRRMPTDASVHPMDRRLVPPLPEGRVRQFEPPQSGDTTARLTQSAAARPLVVESARTEENRWLPAGFDRAEPTVAPRLSEVGQMPRRSAPYQAEQRVGIAAAVGAPQISTVAAGKPQVVDPPHLGIGDSPQVTAAPVVLAETPHSTQETVFHPLRGHSADLARDIARQLAPNVQVARDGAIEIGLSPKELGHVRMSLHLSDGSAVLTVFADRPETADLMRRHAGEMTVALQDLGYGQVAFSFASGGDPSSGDAEGNGPAAEASTDEGVGGDPEMPGQAQSRPVSGTSALDLRL